MIDPSGLSHAARVLARIDPEFPADLALRRYFADVRHLGPRERRAISRAVFTFFRWRQWLDEKAPLQKQIEQAGMIEERFIRDSRSIKPEALAAFAVPGWLKDEMVLEPGFLRKLQQEPALWLRARPGTGARLAAALGDCEITPKAPDAIHYKGSRDLFLPRNFTRALSKSRTFHRSWSATSPPRNRARPGGTLAPGRAGKRCTWPI
jgi:16S rRNA (cytosine967-C5)-methyltransferase